MRAFLVFTLIACTLARCCQSPCGPSCLPMPPMPPLPVPVTPTNWRVLFVRCLEGGGGPRCWAVCDALQEACEQGCRKLSPIGATWCPITPPPTIPPSTQPPTPVPTPIPAQPPTASFILPEGGLDEVPSLYSDFLYKAIANTNQELKKPGAFCSTLAGTPYCDPATCQCKHETKYDRTIAFVAGMHGNLPGKDFFALAGTPDDISFKILSVADGCTGSSGSSSVPCIGAVSVRAPIRISFGIPVQGNLFTDVASCCNPPLCKHHCGCDGGRKCKNVCNGPDVTMYVDKAWVTLKIQFYHNQQTGAVSANLCNGCFSMDGLQTAVIGDGCLGIMKRKVKDDFITKWMMKFTGINPDSMERDAINQFLASVVPSVNQWIGSLIPWQAPQSCGVECGLPPNVFVNYLVNGAPTFITGQYIEIPLTLSVQAVINGKPITFQAKDPSAPPSQAETPYHISNVAGTKLLGGARLSHSLMNGVSWAMGLANYFITVENITLLDAHLKMNVSWADSNNPPSMTVEGDDQMGFIYSKGEARLQCEDTGDDLLAVRWDTLRGNGTFNSTTNATTTCVFVNVLRFDPNSSHLILDKPKLPLPDALLAQLMSSAFNSSLADLNALLYAAKICMPPDLAAVFRPPPTVHLWRQGAAGQGLGYLEVLSFCGPPASGAVRPCRKPPQASKQALSAMRPMTPTIIRADSENFVEATDTPCPSDLSNDSLIEEFEKERCDVWKPAADMIMTPFHSAKSLPVRATGSIKIWSNRSDCPGTYDFVQPFRDGECQDGVQYYCLEGRVQIVNFDNSPNCLGNTSSTTFAPVDSCISSPDGFYGFKFECTLPPSESHNAWVEYVVGIGGTFALIGVAVVCGCKFRAICACVNRGRLCIWQPIAKCGELFVEVATTSCNQTARACRWLAEAAKVAGLALCSLRAKPISGSLYHYLKLVLLIATAGALIAEWVCWQTSDPLASFSRHADMGFETSDYVDSSVVREHLAGWSSSGEKALSFCLWCEVALTFFFALKFSRQKNNGELESLSKQKRDTLVFTGLAVILSIQLLLLIVPPFAFPLSLQLVYNSNYRITSDPALKANAESYLTLAFGGMALPFIAAVFLFLVHALAPGVFLGTAIFVFRLHGLQRKQHPLFSPAFIAREIVPRISILNVVATTAAICGSCLPVIIIYHSIGSRVDWLSVFFISWVCTCVLASCVAKWGIVAEQGENKTALLFGVFLAVYILVYFILAAYALRVLLDTAMDGGFQDFTVAFPAALFFSTTFLTCATTTAFLDLTLTNVKANVGNLLEPAYLQQQEGDGNLPAPVPGDEENQEIEVSGRCRRYWRRAVRFCAECRSRAQQCWHGFTSLCGKLPCCVIERRYFKKPELRALAFRYLQITIGCIMAVVVWYDLQEENDGFRDGFIVDAIQRWAFGYGVTWPLGNVTMLDDAAHAYEASLKTQFYVQGLAVMFAICSLLAYCKTDAFGLWFSRLYLGFAVLLIFGSSLGPALPNYLALSHLTSVISFCATQFNFVVLTVVQNIVGIVCSGLFAMKLLPFLLFTVPSIVRACTMILCADLKHPAAPQPNERRPSINDQDNDNDQDNVLLPSLFRRNVQLTLVLSSALIPLFTAIPLLVMVQFCRTRDQGPFVGVMVILFDVLPLLISCIPCKTAVLTYVRYVVWMLAYVAPLFALLLYEALYYPSLMTQFVFALKDPMTYVECACEVCLTNVIISDVIYGSLMPSPPPKDKRKADWAFVLAPLMLVGVYVVLWSTGTIDTWFQA